MFRKQLLDANTVTSQRLEWFILTARAQVSEHQIVHNLLHQSQPILPSPSIAPPPEPFTLCNAQTNGAPTQSEVPEARVWKAERFREKAYLVKFKREADHKKSQAQWASKEREREEVRDQEGREREMREQKWEELNISSVHTRDSLTARAMQAIDLHSSPVIEMCWSKVNAPPTIVPSADAPVVDMCWGTVTSGESVGGPLTEVSPRIDGPLAEVSPRIDMCWGSASEENRLMNLCRRSLLGSTCAGVAQVEKNRLMNLYLLKLSTLH